MEVVTRPAKRRTRKKPKGEISLEVLSELIGVTVEVFRARHVCQHCENCLRDCCEKRLPKGDSWILQRVASWAVENKAGFCFLPSPKSNKASRQEIQRLGAMC